MKNRSIAAIYTTAVLFFAIGAKAEPQQKFHLDSPKDAIHCLVKGSSEIEDGNMENEYHVTTSTQARQDLLVLMKHQSHRPQVQKAMSYVAKAAYIGLVAQYQDEPYLYYFLIMPNGQIVLALELNTIDLYHSFKDVKDLATFNLHIADVSPEFKESVEYTFKEKYE